MKLLSIRAQDWRGWPSKIKTCTLCPRCARAGPKRRSGRTQSERQGHD